MHTGRQWAACALSAISESTPVPAAVLKRTRGKEGMCFSQFSCQPLTLPSHPLPWFIYLIIPMLSYCSSSSSNTVISRISFSHLSPKSFPNFLSLTRIISLRSSVSSFPDNNKQQSCSRIYKINVYEAVFCTLQSPAVIISPALWNCQPKIYIMLYCISQAGGDFMQPTFTLKLSVIAFYWCTHISMWPVVCECSWCCSYLWGRQQQGAASDFLFPVLPASPPLLWFYNQHFSFRSLEVAQLCGSLELNMCIVGNTQRPPYSYKHSQSHMWKCDSSAILLLPVGVERPFLCTSATEID